MDEGIQPDFSFHQHGPLLYFAGYGHDFAVDTAELAYLARETAFRFLPEQIDILTGYLLDGSRWAVHGRATYDFAAAGRVVARPSTQDDARVLSDAARQLAVAGSSRADELEALAVRIDGGANTMRGNRHFWRSDYQSHHGAGWSSSVKMCSTRTAPTETGNGEALRSWYLGEGINPVWISGEDYRDLYPVWDWRRLPGLTAEQRTGELPVLDWHRAPDGSVMRGGREFVGGVSDGRRGMAVMRLAKDAITDGRKAWFFFDHEVVALGAGIEAAAAQAPVHTTLNQTVAGDGEISHADAAGEVVLGAATVRDPRWAHHGRIGYVFPTATGPVLLERQTRTGSWQDISRPESAEPLSRKLVTVAIDHGPGATGAGYAYITVPGVTREQTAAYSDSSPISIIANNPAVQAVRHDLLGVAQLAFYRPGHLEVATRLRVSVDAPVLLQITDEADGMTLAAANPRNAPLTVTVDCGTPVRIDLPGGAAAGRPVIVRLPTGPLGARP
jgi:chondroitin AC lyase